MRKLFFLTLLLFVAPFYSEAQVGIGTTAPAPDAILELQSTNKALLITRVAEVETIINPVNGMMVYDISLQCVRSFQKGVWSECNSVISPVISSLDCNNATFNGALKAGNNATGVTATIPYSGGNGGNYNGQIVSSTGVTGLTATLFSGTLATGDGTLLYTIQGTPSATGTASFMLTIAGTMCSINVPVSAGGPVVSTINCASRLITGTLTENTNTSGVFASITYTGGNGSNYEPQLIPSTGVTGVTALLNSGTLTSGAGGTIVLSLTGTPSSPGTAFFDLSFAGITCSFSVPVAVQPAVVSFASCSAGSTGTMTQGQTASGVTQTVTYNGANGANYDAVGITSSGVSGLTASLSAGTLANGNGTLVFTITGTPSNSGTATFNLSLFGSSCSFTRTVDPPSATATLTCGSATFNPTTITQNVAYSGTITLPYTAGNSQSYSLGNPINSTGVLGLTARLQAGTLGVTGNLIYNVSGSPTSSGIASFNLTFGASNCVVTRTVNGPIVGALTCGSATFTPSTISSNSPYSGTMLVPYTGGNGAPYVTGSPISSTVVLGLTATLQAGTLAIGSGNLTYTISGTPTSGGNANFALSFGSQSCNVIKPVTSFPPSYTSAVTFPARNHLPANIAPVFFDGFKTYTSQDANYGDMGDLRLHQDNQDIVQVGLSPAVIPTAKIVISWSKRNKPNGGFGLIVELRNGTTLSQAAINTLSGILPNSTQTAAGDDMTLTITVTATTNSITIKSSQDGDGADPNLMEIEVFNSNNVKIPIN